MFPAELLPKCPPETDGRPESRATAATVMPELARVSGLDVGHRLPAIVFDLLDVGTFAMLGPLADAAFSVRLADRRRPMAIRAKVTSSRRARDRWARVESPRTRSRRVFRTKRARSRTGCVGYLKDNLTTLSGWLTLAADGRRHGSRRLGRARRPTPDARSSRRPGERRRGRGSSVEVVQSGAGTGGTRRGHDNRADEETAPTVGGQRCAALALLTGGLTSVIITAAGRADTVIDVPGEIVLETFAFPGPSDPNRCVGYNFVEFPAIPGAGVYTAVVFNKVLGAQQTFSTGPSVFPSDSITVTSTARRTRSRHPPAVTASSSHRGRPAKAVAHSRSTST